MAPAARKRLASQDKPSSDGHSHKRVKQANTKRQSGRAADPVLPDEDPDEGVTATAATSGQLAGTISSSTSRSYNDARRTKPASKQDPRLQQLSPAAEGSAATTAEKNAGRGQSRKSIEESVPSGEDDGWNQDQSANASMTQAADADSGSQGATDLTMSLTHLPAATVKQLQNKYHLSNMRIISSSSIQTKVTQLVNSLSRIDMLDRSSKPGLVLLHADSKAASKLISVAEIAKREIEDFDKAAPSAGRRSGFWYQYSRVDGTIKELKKVDRTASNGGGGTDGSSAVGDTGESNDLLMATQHDGDGSGPHADGGERAGPSTGNARASGGAPTADSSDDEHEFETMEERGEGGQGGQHGQRKKFEHQSSIPAADKHGERKVRAVPVLSVFLSRVRVPELEATLGEQTNAPSKREKTARTLA